MSGLRRTVLRQTDVIEWFTKHSADVAAMRARRWQLEKGVVAYAKDIFEFISEMRSARTDRKALTTEQKAAKAVENRNSPLAQYERSQELLRKLKWKRISWEPEANYDEFAQRISDEDAAFAKTRAFSYLSVKVVRDPSVAAALGDEKSGADAAKPKVLPTTNMRELKSGSLTSWFLEQRERVPIPAYKRPTTARPAPVSVLWESGEVKVLDTASPREIATFLQTLAPRVQAIQLRIDAEQTKATEDIEVAKRRTGAFAIKFNKNDVSFWDDEERAKDPLYVTPAHVRQFLDSVLSRALLLRWYWRGQHIRIVHPSQPYAIDNAANEIHVPANFADFCFLPIHGRWATVESWANGVRKLMVVWFMVGAMIIGDLEIL